MYRLSFSRSSIIRRELGTTPPVLLNWVMIKIQPDHVLAVQDHTEDGETLEGALTDVWGACLQQSKSTGQRTVRAQLLSNMGPVFGVYKEFSHMVSRLILSLPCGLGRTKKNFKWCVQHSTFKRVRAATQIKPSDVKFSAASCCV